MVLNVNKCCVVRYTTKQSPILHNYEMHDSVLTLKTIMKDLGITFSSNGKFDTHISNITNKAFRTLGFINRSFKNFYNPLTYITLFNSLVRPTLEYASPVWSPYTQTNKTVIESVQSHFLRRLAYLSGTPMNYDNHDYDPIKTEYSIISLTNRRTIADLLFLYKILHKLINSSSLRNLISLAVPVRNLRNQQLLTVRFCRTTQAQSSTINRISSLGNSVNSNYKPFELPFINFVRFIRERFSN